MGIARVMTAQESVKLDGVDSKVWLTYLEQICDTFRGEVPHVKHPKLVWSALVTSFTSYSSSVLIIFSFSTLQDLTKIREARIKPPPDFSYLLKHTSRRTRSPSNEVDGGAHKPTADVHSRRSRKRRSADKFGNIVSFWEEVITSFIRISLHSNAFYLREINQKMNLRIYK